jgi:hypothetical protein
MYSQLHIRSDTEGSDLFVHTNISALSAVFPDVLKCIGIFSEHSTWFYCRVRPSGPYRRPSGASACDRAVRLLL